MLGAAVSARAAPSDEWVAALFRPPAGAMMALSPDGQRIAYTNHAGGELEILIAHLGQPGPPRRLRVESAAGADSPAPPLRFLRWATEDRLIFAPPERIAPLPPITDKRGRSTPNPDGPAILAPIFFVDADGRQQGTLVDARHFMETPEDAVRSLADLLRTPMELAAARRRDEPVRWRMPHLDIVGFDPTDRERLVIRTHGAYSAPAQHAVDIRTGHLTQFGGELPPPPAEGQVYDWFRLAIVGERLESKQPETAWRDEEMHRMQRELEEKFPRRIVEILDWNAARTRVLFRVTGGRDPGRVFVFQRPEDLALEVLRLAPWLNQATLHDTRFFEHNPPDGGTLSGYLTWPGRSVRNPPPLLVIFPSGFPGPALPAFDPEAQLFATLGFAVARLNHRWAGGRHAGEPDARAALAWLSRWRAERPFDSTRVAALGRGFGGYLAVRALQLHPGVFRCGVAIDAAREPGAWLQAGSVSRPSSAAQPPLIWDPAAGLENPLLLLVSPGRHPAVDGSTAALRAQLQAIGRPPEYVELDPGFAARRPDALVTAYRHIGYFLQQHLEQPSDPPRRAGTVE